MATGWIEPVHAAFDRGGEGSFELAALPLNARGLDHHPISPFMGDFTFHNPDPISQTYDGFRDFAFLDDFYFRVYLIPQILDYGAIVTTATRDITVWNAYFTPVVLQSIVPEFGVEVALEEEPFLPNTIPALTLRSWSFTVTTEGPPTLDESFTWTFNTGETFVLPVTGTRSVLWPFLPNWTDTFNITRTYATDMFESRSGREQRSAGRVEPRVSLEFLATITGTRKDEYRRLMTFWQDRPFIVADISRNVATEEPLPSGSTTVQVSDITSWLAQEDRAVVLASGDLIGLRVIDSIDSAGVVTFKDQDGVDWPTGTKIYAGLVANLEDERRMTRHTNRTISGRITFNVVPGTDIPPETPAPAFMFNDRELFMRRPNWGETVESADRHITEYVDYGDGRLERFSPRANAVQAWTQTFVGRDVADIQELFDVFDRAKGRQGEFYMPTWEEDLTAKEALLDGSLGLRVEGTDVFNAYADDETSRAVLVVLHDGTQIFRVVDNITELDDAEGHDSLINFTEVWDDTYDPEDIDLICWVKCWRFATDDLTAEFLTNSVANLRMSMQTLPDLAAENEEDSNSP